VVATSYVVTRDVTRYHTWRVVGDLDALAGLLAGAVLIVPAATLLGCRLGHIHRPGLDDHLAQALGYYMLLVTAGAWLWHTAASTGGGLGWAVAALLTGAAPAAILVNALTLAAGRFRRRGQRSRAPSRVREVFVPLSCVGVLYCNRP
jgi:hypothetical protein